MAINTRSGRRINLDLCQESGGLALVDRDTNSGRRPLGVGEYFVAELRQAFQDIRQKVIEEGWFGRVVTAAPVVEVDRARDARGFYGDDHQPLSPERTACPDHRPSFEELWSPKERAKGEHDHQPELGIDIDR
jgi:hypothetical protein